MAEIQAADVTLAAAGEPAAPGRNAWQRLEPAALGTGTIVALLLFWQFLPDIVPLKAGTKLFFAVPSQVAGAL